ncbi:MAG: NAD(P)H-hydrate epimerase [Candidatus Omnitrophica bacterium]|jgi:NAD(P)H-hydrate epimerase|nr:NAD(P)H-hydrate epimerase [Candidatus Omnitrophota bacterium]MDD5078317.1 NAD(P)H-hydrate epimerase [Candidatus Omnitrophota bacterium]
MNRKEFSLTAASAAALDKKAQEVYGIPALVLMENAGRSVAEEALKALKKHPGRVAVFCGTGNNGGDGFCACRHLLASGVKPDLYLAGSPSKLKAQAKVNYNILLKLKQKISGSGAFGPGLPGKRSKKYSLILDALLGIGIRGEARPVYRESIRAINSSGAFVIAVDIPSGLDADSGKPLGACVKADETITFVSVKRGMLLNPGKGYCGKVRVRGIGVKL